MLHEHPPASFSRQMHMYKEIEQLHSSMRSFSRQACLLQLYDNHLTAFHETKAAFCVYLLPPQALLGT